MARRALSPIIAAIPITPASFRIWVACGRASTRVSRPSADYSAPRLFRKESVWPIQVGHEHQLDGKAVAGGRQPDAGAEFHGDGIAVVVAGQPEFVKLLAGGEEPTQLTEAIILFRRHGPGIVN